MKITNYDTNGNVDSIDFCSPIHIEKTMTFTGKAKTSDYALSPDDMYVGVNCTSGDVTLTIPDASSLDKTQHWFIKRMDNSANLVYVSLETPSDSMYGSDFSSLSLLRMGAGVEILLNANGEYVFSTWDGIQNPKAHPAVTTQTPSLTDTTLTMNGTLEALGSFANVEVYFRYRNVTTGGAWELSSKVVVSAAGSFTDTATVTAGNTYEVQAMVDDSVDTHSGAVLRTSVNYYSSTTEASIDGLERGWPMQETTGTDTAASELMQSDDMTMYNGVTISSDTINSQTIYKRIFGTNDYGQSGYQPDWTYNGSSKTILIQIDMDSASGDHTILNFGRNILSIASDGTGIQLEINNSIKTWSSATPFSGILNLFITVDRDTWLTSLYTCTSTTRTLRASDYKIPDNQAAYTRLGRGSSGDSNHQDYEYMDDGEVRSLWVWNRVLSEAEMKDICNVLDNSGGQVVL